MMNLFNMRYNIMNKMLKFINLILFIILHLMKLLIKLLQKDCYYQNNNFHS